MALYTIDEFNYSEKTKTLYSKTNKGYSLSSEMLIKGKTKTIKFERFILIQEEFYLNVLEIINRLRLAENKSFYGCYVFISECREYFVIFAEEIKEHEMYL